MGELTVDQIQKATKALVERDEKLAKEVVKHDYEIDLLEINVDDLALRILALRQPVASDLRTVVAALKVSNQVERIADYASNIAKRALDLTKTPPLPIAQELVSLAKIPQEMIKKALTAFASHDLDLAFEVWYMDQQVDDLYHAYLLKLFDEMVADPKNINSCTQLLFAAKNFERMGDQSQNIAEAVYTMETGKPFKESKVYKDANKV
jgi:phosphate transport system protein